MYTSSEYGNTKVLPGLFKERIDVNKAYLMELNLTALLQNYYLEAGIQLPGMQAVFKPEETYMHWGWEAPECQLRGHFMGHWLSASSILYATTKADDIKGKIDYIISEIRRCQIRNGGRWTGPIPEKFFDILITGEYIWSPQYTMHKLIMGLTDAYRYAGNEEAMVILDNLALWYVDWIAKVNSINPEMINSGEEGGMLEAWAVLYSLTRKDIYLELAKAYSHKSMFTELLEGKDPLSNAHMNSSIPHAHGAAAMYEATGDKYWLDVAVSFWKCGVENREYYATGGQSAGEFWIPPHRNGAFMNDRNQEFCTVYNMVRLADYLFRFTGDKKYLDYIERNLYNGFLAQQNKHTGMPTYFLPMSAGAKKVWGTKTHDFWCCTGTMVQAQTIYPSLIYYKDSASNTVTVSQYIPSEINDALSQCNDFTIRLCTDMKSYNDEAFYDNEDQASTSRWKMKLVVSSAGEMNLKLRIPEWVDGKPVISVNGQDIPAVVEDGFVTVSRKFENTEIGIYLAPSLTVEALPDIPGRVAVLEGPIVLVAECDKNEVPSLCGQTPDKILTPFVEHTYITFPWQQSFYKLLNSGREYNMVPLYDITDSNYTIYLQK